MAWPRGATQRPSPTATESYFIARRLFIVGIALVYAIAFGSLLPQILGLVGEHGIVPIADRLPALRDQIGERAFVHVPTLLWFDASDFVLRVSVGVGFAASLLLALGIAPPLLLLLLFVIYGSLVAAGGPFLSFQWDALLLEAGFLAIFVAPLQPWYRASREAPPSRLVLFLLRLLLFKLMFSSGVVKLASADPAWRDLTALTFHYETQPLPSWISWHAHQAPDAFHRASAVVMFAIEIAVPFFAFGPRRLRRLAAGFLAALQVLIAATGNYGFFNLLALVLCLPLLDDGVWPRIWRARFRLGRWHRRRGARPWPAWTLVLIAVLLVPLDLSQTLAALRRSPPLPVWFQMFERTAREWHLSSSYGLFAVMTTTRPEIVIEGSADGVAWRPYRFAYKVQELDRRPPIVVGHMPRLDWQMWFAALRGERQRPWFTAFCRALLEGRPQVTRLLHENPFPETPPTLIRARLFLYEFTTPEERKQTGHWWNRRELGDVVPPSALPPAAGVGSAPDQLPNRR